MEKFFQAVALALLTVVLTMVLQKQGKETALLLSLLACCMLGVAAMAFLRPVVAFLQKLQSIGSLDGAMLQTLLKIVGIAITTEVAGLICTDAGNASLGKMLGFLGAGVILWLSLPMITALLELVESILVAI